MRYFEPGQILEEIDIDEQIEACDAFKKAFQDFSKEALDKEKSFSGLNAGYWISTIHTAGIISRSLPWQAVPSIQCCALPHFSALNRRYPKKKRIL